MKTSQRNAQTKPHSSTLPSFHHSRTSTLPSFQHSRRTPLWVLVLGLVAVMAVDCAAQKKKPSLTYIGYVYPAGGQQGTTFPIRVGGQKLTGVYGAVISGEGAHARVIESRIKLSSQDTKLLKEQLKKLKEKSPENDEVAQRIKLRINTVMGSYVQKPANESLSTIVLLEVTLDNNAAPGAREIRIMTSKGLSNPLAFYVGQLPEVSRKPMKTSKVQTLGKEHLALRKRPEDEVEQQITLPCTLNGQVASGELNRYRFNAKKGQKLVISTLARQLVPYIADAVPGWFQPILTLRNANGKEVAFNDDYRFKPDPTILYKVEETGDYILTINDSIYRGREDFVYRITIGETPFITGIFPLGGKERSPANTKIQGWNLQRTRLSIPSKDAQTGVHLIAANRADILSNVVPFSIDSLPERLEQEKNTPQSVTLPIIINGRSDFINDLDVYKFKALAGKVIVAEVYARRLDSPLDSILRLTDSGGTLLAFNDDHSDPASGLNTHHADSYLMARIPADGTYFIHLSDTSRRGGDAYAYRLRISEPIPDFELRTVPSRLNFKSKSGASVDVFVIRKDGYEGPIQLRLKDAPEGFLSKKVSLPAGEEKVRFNVKTTLKELEAPVALQIEGYVKIGNRKVSHLAVPSEDWMQAFLWRHLVPAEELLAQVYNPSLLPQSERIRPELPAFAEEITNKNYKERTPTQKKNSGSITKLGRLYDEWLITEDFYLKKVEEFKDFK